MTRVPPVERSLPAVAAFAQLGDRDALEELLRRLQHPLSEHIRGIVNDDDLAEDVLQDTLIIVSRRLGSIREPEWVRAWAYRVATREAVRSAKRMRRDRGNPLDDLAEIPEPAAGAFSGIADEELLAELPARLAALPLGAQLVLRLHYLQSLTQQEVAEALSIPLGTVKSRLSYGLSFLRKQWTSPQSP